MVLVQHVAKLFRRIKILKRKPDQSSLVRNSIFFDEKFYAAQEGVPGGIDLARHYVTTGWKSGIMPSNYFDPEDYFNRYPDVKATGVNPLIHYLTHGCAEGRDPSWKFDRKRFLEEHPDLRRPEIDAAAECIKIYGGYNSQNASHLPLPVKTLFDPGWYVASSPDLDIAEDEAYDHYFRIGWKEGRDPNPLFDTDWYLLTYPDVAKMGLEPLNHFEKYGYLEGRRPNPIFDTEWYTETYRDVRGARLNPLLHFIQFGEAEGRDPHPRFNTCWYRETFKESTEFPWGIFAYHFRIGRSQGQKPHPVYSDILVVTPGELGRSGASSGKLLFPNPLEPYESWLEVNQDTASERSFLEQNLAELADRTPLVSVIMPTYQSDRKLLATAIESVRSQLYTNWQLCICDDASPNRTVVDHIAA